MWSRHLCKIQLKITNKVCIKKCLLSFMHDCTRQMVRMEKSFYKSKANFRTNIISAIAKEFNNVPLEDFPIGKIENLSNYDTVHKVNNECHTKYLDHNPSYYPSISTILNQTMPPESVNALKRWEEEKIKYKNFFFYLAI